MPHRYINVSTEFMSDYGSSARTERIRERLKDERGVCRSAESDYDKRIAEKNVANLQQALERAEANQAASQEHRKRVEQERNTKFEAHQAAEQAAIETDLRQRYDRALPIPTTDAQWEDVREAVLHKHRLSQMDKTDELIAATARRYKL